MRSFRAAPVLLMVTIGLLAPAAIGAAAGATPVPPATTPGTTAATTPLLDQPRRGEDAIRRLGAHLGTAALRSGGSVAGLVELLREDATMWVDRAGQAFAVEPPRTGPVAASTAEPPVGQAPATTSDVFRLHSAPGSARVIYLDFDGHLVRDTGWNTSYTGGAPFTAGPYDADGRPGSFSAAELAVVKSVWQRVAEDYAPFDVDVTTQEPPAEAIERSAPSDLRFGTRALITNTTVGYSACRCGGIAYVGTFDAAGSHSRYQPALVFQRGVGPSAKTLAEAASHEVGHNLGLHHDGLASSSYFSGHAGWAPIMGVGYYRPVSQWSQGEYRGATNREDDIGVMLANGVALRPDDHANALGSASVLVGATPKTTARITTRADVDAFSFSTGGGAVTVAATPAGVGADLDIRLWLLSSTGRVLAYADPPMVMRGADATAGLGATWTGRLGRGSYVVLVEGVGAGSAAVGGYSDYGSLGGYTLAATIPYPAPEPPTSVTALAAATSATVRWVDRSRIETGFEVLRETYDEVAARWGPATVVKRLAANATALAEALAPGTYRYQVRALNATGRSAVARSATVTIPPSGGGP